MDIELEPGTYVVAVSGGVDSMVLLDMLVRRGPGLQLIVAHLDHGIREDSGEDRRLVANAAARHGLAFVFDEAALGPEASEVAARKARYAFLEKVRQASGACAVLTAHHQDDALETAVLNILRGTGRRGLTALKSRGTLLRPLLHVPKASLLAHARAHNVRWREDSTNQDERYLRNYIRRRVLPRFSEAQKRALLSHIENLRAVETELEQLLEHHLRLHPALDQLDRHQFIMLPHVVAREVMAAWLRRHQIKNLSAAKLERLVTAAKTGSPGTKNDVDKTHVLHVRRRSLALQLRER